MKRVLTLGAIAGISSFIFAVSLANTLAELLKRREEEVEPRCRYCGADCSDGRSYDGAGLYACPQCSDLRAQVNAARKMYEQAAEQGHDAWRL